MAIIAICPKWSDLANLVIDNEAGWVIDNAPGSRPDDPTTFMVGGNSTREQQVAREFVAVIQRIHANPEELESKRRNAHRVAHGRFGVSAIEERWAQFLMEVEAQG
jgi:glycosyltransferase involved in cell wall biosynthesis